MEGLILDKRPRSAKGDRRSTLDGRVTRTIQDMPTVDVNSINNRGIHELFSDILYDSETEGLEASEYKDDFEDEEEDEEEEEDWSDECPPPFMSPPAPLSSRCEQYRRHLVTLPQSPSIVSGMKYNEWQRNSGMRVLRKVLDRQKLLQTSDLKGSSSSTFVRQH